MDFTDEISKAVSKGIDSVKSEILGAVHDAVAGWGKNDVWISSKVKLEEELGWGRSIIDQIFEDPDLQDAIVIYGPRTFSVNVTLLRKLIKKKSNNNHHK